MEKVLVLGSNGMLGHKLVEILQSDERIILYHTARGNQIHTDFIPLDITNTKELVAIINSIRPTIIINCCGVLVDSSNKNPVNAFHINGSLPLVLDSLTHIFGFRLIQISTDCIFSGASGPYHVDSPKDGKDHYSTSKQLGENISDSNLVIRTSIVGPEIKSNKTGLFEWFVEATRSSKSVSGFKNVYWSGLSTLSLSRVIQSVIFTQLSGVLQLSGSKAISKHEMLQLFRDSLQSDIELEMNEDKISNKALIRNNDSFNDLIPPYKEMFDELIEDYQSNSWYKKI